MVADMRDVRLPALFAKKPRIRSPHAPGDLASCRNSLTAASAERMVVDRMLSGILVVIVRMEPPRLDN